MKYGFLENQYRVSRIEDGGSIIEDRGSWIEDRGSRIVDRGSWIEDRGSRIEDRVSRIQMKKKITEICDRPVQLALLPLFSCLLL